MLDLYAVWRLVPYVFAFISEQLIRVRSKAWPSTQGTVTAGGIEGDSFPYAATLHYEYRIESTLFCGSLSRRCLRRRSAEAVAELPPGSRVTVYFQHAKPERSYIALPLGWGGFAVAAFPVFGFAALILFLTFALIQERYIEAHDAIPNAQWRRVGTPQMFQVEMPGPATPTIKPVLKLEIDGAAPSASGWEVERNGAYFYAGVLQYPIHAMLNLDTLDKVLRAVKQEDPKRYVYGDQELTLNGRNGRQFEFTRPYTTMRVYLDGQRLYFVTTDWYVGSDTRRFMASFRIE